MLAFVVEVRAFVLTGRLYPFALLMAVIWSMWVIRVFLARRYRPWVRGWETSVSVLSPVAGEEPDLFREVLSRIIAQEPDEVLVVINGPQDRGLAEVCAATPGVLWTWTPQGGKRNALRMALQQASCDIAVIVDSDTLWTAGTLRELVKPFRDPEIGGVSTRQRILQPQRSVLTRWAGWLGGRRGGDPTAG